MKTYKVVTRESQLALWQTNYVISLLKEAHPQCDFEIVRMETKGDKILDQALSSIGDKGLFTQELESAMLNHEVDFAVHSLKDMPTKLPEGLNLSAVIKRHDHRDALLSKSSSDIAGLPKDAVVGTSSLRRKSQLLHLRPDLRVRDLRGNVNTRLRKYQEEDFDAIILASAGLDRLNFGDVITRRLETDQFMSAVGQGAVVIESRTDDKEVEALLTPINDKDTELAIRAERAFMRVLEGGCQVPMGAYASIEGESIILEGFVGSLDGKVLLRDHIKYSYEEPEIAGEKLASKMISQGAKELLASVCKQAEK